MTTASSATTSITNVAGAPPTSLWGRPRAAHPPACELYGVVAEAGHGFIS